MEITPQKININIYLFSVKKTSLATVRTLAVAAVVAVVALIVVAAVVAAFVSAPVGSLDRPQVPTQ